jgi:hypothetical protein
MSTNGTILGTYLSVGSGSAANILLNAFSNPRSLDIVQVVNEGGNCVWNLNNVGLTATNPTGYTQGPGGKPQALMTLFGNTFAQAIASASNSSNPLDLLQVLDNNGGAVLFHVNNSGLASTP